MRVSGQRHDFCQMVRWSDGLPVCTLPVTGLRLAGWVRHLFGGLFQEHFAEVLAIH